MVSEVKTICAHADLTDLANADESGEILDNQLLDTFRDLRDSAATTADLFIFTDETPGHVWCVNMVKSVDGQGFRFAAFHQCPLCSPQCRATLDELSVSP